MTQAETSSPERSARRIERVTIRFAGDSGDGMQLTGDQFTQASAMGGNDLRTLPDFPAEIRAPAGTVAGVSAFQIQIGATEIYTPGDKPDVLVAMNPAALKYNLPDLGKGSVVIVNRDAFTAKALDRAGFESDPLDDGSLEDFQLIEVPFNTLTQAALLDSELPARQRDRSKNFFALGLVFWLYGRQLEGTIAWIHQKFAARPSIGEANELALRAGHNFGETTDAFASSYVVPPAAIKAGEYRQMTGNKAMAWGFIAAAEIAGLDLFLGSYPITPASDILHELAKYKHHGVRTFQAEDEIAAVASAIGAAFGGSLALTTTSGPGVALKGEAIGLAAMVELPLIVVNVQRGGPSTGLPTKTEQSDLLQAMYGRNGESSVPILAPSKPTDCFWVAIEAARIATKYMTPVFILSDGYLGNGAEPWKIPELSELPTFRVEFHTDPEGFAPYGRDPETLSRPWVRPGTPGLEHRIGGLEKEDGTGDVSYDPINHETMVNLRTDKVAGIAKDIPDAEVWGETEGDLLYIGWGGTFGSIRAAVIEAQLDGVDVTHLHLRHLNPLPLNVETMLRSFRKIVVCELNLGQLRQILCGRFMVELEGLNKVQGKPFAVEEIVESIREHASQ